MMKQTIRIIGALALTALFLFAGCSGPLNDVIKPALQEGNGSVRVQIGANTDARTLLPSTAFAEYRLEFTQFANNIEINPSGKTVTATLPGGETSIDVELKAGKWRVKVTGLVEAAGGKKLDSVYATIDPDVTVEAGEALSVTIILDKSASTLPGIFKYSVQFPSLGFGSHIKDNYSTAKFTITPKEQSTSEDDNSLTLTFNLFEDDVGHHHSTNNSQRLIEVTSVSGGWHATGELEIHPGAYQLDIDLISKRIITDSVGDEPVAYPAKVKVTEYLYIYPNMVTETPQYVFTDERHFTDKLYFTGTAHLSDYNESGRNYIATTIQVSTTNEDSDYSAYYDFIPLHEIANGVGGATITTNNNWELYINAKDIHKTPQSIDIPNDYLYFRFVSYDATNPALKVNSPWTQVTTANIQGRDPHIDLYATIYTITNTPGPNNVNGVAIPAGTTFVTSNNEGDVNADFAQNTLVRVAVTPPASYGLQQGSFEYGYEYYSDYYSMWQNSPIDTPDYSSHSADTIYFYFTKNSGNTIITEAKFYQLRGTATVTGTNPYAYRPTSITAKVFHYGDWTEIGNASVTNGNYSSISSLPEWFKYDSLTEDVQLTITIHTDQAVPPGDQYKTLSIVETISSGDLLGSITSYIGDPAAPMSPPTGIYSTSTGTPVHITWTSELNAKGYNIYRNGSTTKLNTSLITNSYYYDNNVTANTTYTYRVSTVNIFDVEGNKSSPITGSTYPYFVLTSQKWAEGNLPSYAYQEYGFTAEAGKEYYVRWSDSNQGNGSHSLNIQVYAWWEDDPGTYIINEDSGWNTPSNINNVEATNRNLIIRVESYYYGYSGTYAIGYYPDIPDTEFIVNLDNVTVRNPSPFTYTNEEFDIPLNFVNGNSFTSTYYTKFTVKANFYDENGDVLSIGEIDVGNGAGPGWGVAQIQFFNSGYSQVSDLIYNLGITTEDRLRSAFNFNDGPAILRVQPSWNDYNYVVPHIEITEIKFHN